MAQVAFAIAPILDKKLNSKMTLICEKCEVRTILKSCETIYHFNLPVRNCTAQRTISSKEYLKRYWKVILGRRTSLPRPQQIYRSKLDENWQWRLAPQPRRVSLTAAEGLQYRYWAPSSPGTGTSWGGQTESYFLLHFPRTMEIIISKILKL